jgi:hypothetical protein
MAKTSKLIASVRRMLRDNPDVVRMVSTLTASTSDVTVTLDTGDGARFESAGKVLWTDDFDTNQGVEPLLLRSYSGDVLTVRRAWRDPEMLFGHAAGIDLIIEPRFDDNHIHDELFNILGGELWPYVWNLREFSLNYQAQNEYYPSPHKIHEIIHAYQLYAGTTVDLTTTTTPHQLADATNFPNGAITIPDAIPGFPIYVVGKEVPSTLHSNSPQIENLLVIGAASNLLIAEEGKHVAPDRSAIQERIGEGAKVNAGAALRQLFLDRRTQENIRLETLTDEVRRVGSLR